MKKGSRMNPKSRRVYVYRNLHTGTWSVRQGGRVIAHPVTIWLSDCKFLVGEKGREKVLREKRKNVHAGVSGYILEERKPAVYAQRFCLSELPTKVKYNPYEAGYFRDDKGNKITNSSYAWLDVKEGVWAYNET